MSWVTIILIVLLVGVVRLHLRPMIPLLAVLCAGFAMTSLGAAHQTFNTDPTYLIDTWETQDGLPENSATAMVQTPDGYLWFGTFNGLVRFDGVTFTVFDPANTPQVPSASIINLYCDRSGKLWVSTSRGLAVREGGKWQVAESELPRWLAERLRADIFGTRQWRLAPRPVIGDVDDGDWRVASGEWRRRSLATRHWPPATHLYFLTVDLNTRSR